jgi:hypothetical protein
MGAKVARFSSASVDEVFDAAQLATASLGYDLRSVDATRRTLSFVTATTASDARVVTVCVNDKGSCSEVVVTESDSANSFAARGRLEWALNVPNQFIRALTEILLRPSAGWLTDPSGRFAERWWDGCEWTNLARDSERGPKYQDQPGNLATPVLLDGKQI